MMMDKVLTIHRYVDESTFFGHCENAGILKCKKSNILCILIKVHCRKLVVYLFKTWGSSTECQGSQV